MRIYAISNSNNANKCNNVHFNALIKDQSAVPIIKNMSAKDQLEFKRIKRRLYRTKFWDLKISSIGKEFKELKFKFINKNNKGSVITDGIYPFNRNGNTISFYSIVYGPENASLNTVETLHFKSEKRAEELYEQYKQNALYARNVGYNISPIESLKMKELELNMLEEASRNEHGKRHVTQVNTELQTKPTTGNDLKYRN